MQFPHQGARVAIIHHTGGGESVTGGSRALDLFTDRQELVLGFLARLNDDPPAQTILFLTGDGGNGKSLLIRYLIRHVCRRIKDRDDWAWVKSRPADEAIENVKGAENADDVPCALLDFGMAPRGDDRPQEAFSALLMLNRALSGYGLSFPLFEFACVWYLHKTDRLTDEKLRELFPSEVMDFVTEIAGAVSETSWAYLASAVLRAFDSHMSERYTVYQYQRGLSPAQIQEIQRMDPEAELIDALPRFFAEDLNAAMAQEDAPDRVALFFDTHEAFWGSERGLSDDLYFQYDEWLRCLLANLEWSSGIVAVVAGREAPRWPQAVRYRIPAEFLDFQEVGHFADRDALLYLERAGVKDAALRRALIARARVRRNEVHPFFLGLCADLAETAAQRGEALTAADVPQSASLGQRRQALVDRLLRYVDVEIGTAVRALCACRSFDRRIHERLGREIGFLATEASFAMLGRFSFVWRAPRGGEGSYRIHDLLRRLVRESGDPVTRKADAALEAYYEERARAGDVGAPAAIAYHANQRDWAAGAERWVREFEAALRGRRMDVCRALIEVWTDLDIRGDFERGRVLDAQGDFFAHLADHEEAIDSFEGAILEFDQVLAKAPDDTAAHVNRGASLLGLGEVQATLARMDDAGKSTRAAIAAFDRALALAPDDVSAHHNRGAALERLGRLEAALGRREDALDGYRAAEAAYGEALARAPEDADARTNAGQALQGVGEALAGLGRPDEAVAAFRRAIETADAALRLAPGSVAALNLKGSACARLGDVLEGCGRSEDARKRFAQAIATFDAALKAAPDDAALRNNAGNALQSLGDLEAALGRREPAEEGYRRAIAAYGEALKRAPEYAAAHHNQGAAWQGLARMQAGAGLAAEAMQSYTRAAAAFHEAVRRAPTDVSSQLGKGRALHGLGELQTAAGRAEAAQKSFRKALSALDRALRLAPDLTAAHRAKGEALTDLAELAEAAARPLDARRAWARAATSYRRAHRLEPDDAGLWAAEGGALKELAEVQDALGADREAAASWRRAVAAYEQAARRAPEDAGLHAARGFVLAALGALAAELGRRADAEKAYVAALEALDRVLALVPGHEAAAQRRALAAAALARLRETPRPEVEKPPA